VVPMRASEIGGDDGPWNGFRGNYSVSFADSSINTHGGAAGLKPSSGAQTNSCKFGRVGFANGDRTGAAHPIDHDIVFGGDVVFYRVAIQMWSGCRVALLRKSAYISAYLRNLAIHFVPADIAVGCKANKQRYCPDARALSGHRA
jgi:hypothetical protein